MFNPFSIEGKNILVFGATSGIGRATAISCSQMGANVIASGRDKTKLRQLSIELGDKCSTTIFDLLDESFLPEFVESLPILDGVAFCAGIANMNPFHFVTDEELEGVFKVNFFAPVKICKALLAAKKIMKGASIVFVSSIDGPRVVHAGNSVYSASKSALVGLARNMAIDLSGKKIRVNCVLPGTTDTPMIRTENVDEISLFEKAKSLPMKRFATPDEIANAIIFLLSNASSYITGTEIVVDGGSSLI